MGVLSVSSDSKKPWQDPETLERALEKHGYDVPKTADYLGVTRTTIHKWCKKHDIETKPYSVKEDLERLYVKKGLSAKEVGERLYGSEHSVLDWLRRHDIPVRPSSADKAPHFRTHQGYEEWNVGIDGTYHSVLIHRLLAVAEYGFDEVVGKDIHHKNRIKWDNRPENIEIVTTEEHMREHIEEWDRDEKGRLLPCQ